MIAKELDERFRLASRCDANQSLCRRERPPTMQWQILCSMHPELIQAARRPVTSLLRGYQRSTSRRTRQGIDDDGPSYCFRIRLAHFSVGFTQSTLPTAFALPFILSAGPLPIQSGIVRSNPSSMSHDLPPSMYIALPCKP